MLIEFPLVEMEDVKPIISGKIITRLKAMDLLDYTAVIRLVLQLACYMGQDV